MNAKIWGAIAVALVLGACGAKKEEPAADAGAAATDAAAPADAAAAPADAAAAPADAAAAPADASKETTPPSQ